MKFLLIIGILFCSVMILCAGQDYSRFNQIDLNKVRRVIGFGDGYVDVGNTFIYTTNQLPPAWPAPEGYDGFEGVTTNGKPFWIQLIERFTSLSTSDLSEVDNRAWAGAGVSSTLFPTSSVGGDPVRGYFAVPGFEQQVDGFLEDNPRVGEGTLFMIFVGQHDYFDATIFVNSETIFARAAAVTAKIAQQVDRLLSASAPNCWAMVIGLPSLDEIPAAKAQQNPALLQGLEAATLFHNGQLSQQIEAIDRRVNSFGFRAIWLDPTAQYARLYANPQRVNKFSEMEVPCFNQITGEQCSHPPAYYWWDSFYPTQSAHHFLKETVYRLGFIQGKDFDVSSANLLQYSMMMIMIVLIVFIIF